MNEMTPVTVPYDVAAIRGDFPILKRMVHGHPLVYFDTAASAQKPQAVISAMSGAFEHEYANVHRALHDMGNEVTARFEGARECVRQFIGAGHAEEIIFTGGGTDSLNLIASSFAAPLVEKDGGEIVLSMLEHHSNIVPWHFLRERHGAALKWIPCDDNGVLDLEAYAALLGPRTRMVAITHLSNALGRVTPIDDIIRIAHERGIPVAVDGCQGAVHLPVDVKKMDCDFYAFTGHKIYGPGGVGVLYGKREHLDSMRPYRGGGEMIREVGTDAVSYGDLPWRFEAGTPPIVEAIGLAAALEYIESVGRKRIAAHELDLVAYADRRLADVKGLRILGRAPGENNARSSIVSFVVDDAHPHDVAAVVDRAGVALRAGHHCAQPLMDRLGVSATARVSFGMYNTREEVDVFIDALNRGLELFR